MSSVITALRAVKLASIPAGISANPESRCLMSSCALDVRHVGTVQRWETYCCECAGKFTDKFKDCQRKAWKAYHKLDCKTFKEYPTMAPRTRALHRLLNENENGFLSPEQWKGVMTIAHCKTYWFSESIQSKVLSEASTTLKVMALQNT
jgi:hypothetical protein